MMAAFRLGVPSTGVYLVKPALIAPIAAFLMCCGVSKSGSPAPRPMMSRPLALSAAARAGQGGRGFDGLYAAGEFHYGSFRASAGCGSATIDKF